MGLRSAGALQQGVDESLLATVAAGRRGDLEPRQAAAVAVANAFLETPGVVSSTVWEETATELTEDEIAELVLRLTLFSRNKVRVSLGLDEDTVRIRSY
jgi:hypothetical protein